MRKILVLGGYGVFGRRICERLARFDDIELIIAGRSRKKALEFIETLSDPACLVRSLDIDIHTAHISELENQNLFAVINACGPYHDQDYSIAEMCIDIGAHYIDLSDNRDFVANIEVLNGRAKRADVFVTSGASTVPALSSAVLDHYLPAFSQLTSVDYGVTPGNKTDRGVGTIAAILKYVGRPFKTLIKGEERVVHGWQDLHRTHYPVIGKRWMSNCDIPDLDLFRTRYKDLETIRFYAGLELSILHVGLWILSWPCRWGWIKDFDRYASLMRRVSLWFYPLGSDRGGMHVFMRGLDEDGARMQKDWCVIAYDGVGPYIPATPSVILVRKLLDGTLDRRGALPCAGLFSLNDFMEEISDLSIQVYCDVPLYKRYLKERYEGLPRAVQALHDYQGEVTYIGECDVVRGTNPFCKMLAAVLSLPPDGRGHPLSVHFKTEGGAEHWTRSFGKQVFYSKQWDQNDILYEKINITTLAFDIKTSPEALDLVLKQVYVLGLPVGWLFKPKAKACEYEKDGRFCMSIEVHLPLFGLLVKYDGWLSVDG